MKRVVALPVVPEGLELKADHAIAAIALKRRISLQQAADELGRITEAANNIVKAALE